MCTYGVWLIRDPDDGKFQPRWGRCHRKMVRKTFGVGRLRLLSLLIIVTNNDLSHFHAVALPVPTEVTSAC